jgi:hypothetical protein
LGDRLAAANKFMEDKLFAMELVVETMDQEVQDRYEAWPERLYIIVDGVVVYRGGRGPFDYLLHDVQDWLAARYGMRGQSVNRDRPSIDNDNTSSCALK